MSLHVAWNHLLLLLLPCAGPRPYLSLSEAGHAAPGDAVDSNTAAAGYERSVGGFAAPNLMSPNSTAPTTARSMGQGADFRRCVSVCGLKQWVECYSWAIAGDHHKILSVAPTNRSCVTIVHHPGTLVQHGS